MPTLYADWLYPLNRDADVLVFTGLRTFPFRLAGIGHAVGCASEPTVTVGLSGKLGSDIDQ